MTINSVYPIFQHMTSHLILVLFDRTLTRSNNCLSLT